MRRLRLGALIGMVGAAASLGVASGSCKEPTEIVVDVRTNGCTGIRNTSIAVGRPDEIDQRPATIFSSLGCLGSDQIGTLAIQPSGAPDEEIAVKIVTGVRRYAEECKPPYEGCIVARRRIRFVENK